MKKPSSLQATIGIGLTFGVSLLWLIALVFSTVVSKDTLNKSFDSALAASAQRIMPIAVVEIMNRETVEGPQKIMPFDSHEESISYLVRDRSGNILLRSRTADPSDFTQTMPNGFSSSETHRRYGTEAVQSSLHIEVAAPLSIRRQAVLDIARSLLWPIALLIPLCLTGSWMFVRHSLRHVLAYREEIESRGSGNLDPIRLSNLPDEIIAIGESVNHLLERLRRALDSERSFTANSAHELRTPIATALAQVQRMIKTTRESHVRGQLVAIEGSLLELSMLSERLMQLAKAEGGGLMSSEKHDLIALLTLIVDDFRRSYTPGAITLTCSGMDRFDSAINPDIFYILIKNLLDNAIKYGARGKTIEVALRPDGVLSIINSGKALPESILSQLKQRFVRADTTTSGSGLGLAIVDAIANGIGATMTLHSPAAGRDEGFEVRIALPVIE